MAVRPAYLSLPRGKNRNELRARYERSHASYLRGRGREGMRRVNPRTGKSVG